MTGKDIRMNRLFSKGENAVVIAIDHGYMDGPIPGMEDIKGAAAKISPEVDAVLLSPGMLKNLGNTFDYKGAPIPVVRLNWSTVFCFEWGYEKALDDTGVQRERCCRSGCADGAGFTDA